MRSLQEILTDAGVAPDVVREVAADVVREVAATFGREMREDAEFIALQALTDICQITPETRNYGNVLTEQRRQAAEAILMHIRSRNVREPVYNQYFSASDEEGVSYDENTLQKVRQILLEMGFAEEYADEWINGCLNRGILFRERA